MLALTGLHFYISIWREPNNEEMRSIFEFGSDSKAFGSESEV